eukprot:8412634-Pyramimonas_sp.AAC.1
MKLGGERHEHARGGPGLCEVGLDSNSVPFKLQTCAVSSSSEDKGRIPHAMRFLFQLFFPSGKGLSVTLSLGPTSFRMCDVTFAGAPGALCGCPGRGAPGAAGSHGAHGAREARGAS